MAVNEWFDAGWPVTGGMGGMLDQGAATALHDKLSHTPTGTWDVNRRLCTVSGASASAPLHRSGAVPSPQGFNVAGFHSTGVVAGLRCMHPRCMVCPVQCCLGSIACDGQIHKGLGPVLTQLERSFLPRSHTLLHFALAHEAFACSTWPMGSIRHASQLLSHLDTIDESTATLIAPSEYMLPQVSSRC